MTKPLQPSRSDEPPATMRATLLERPGMPLQAVERPVPRPAAGEILLRVDACGVCRTDLHLIDGEVPDPVLPMIPGHEIVGRVAAVGPGVSGVTPGQRMGVPWLGWTCGHCSFCASQRENLCDNARFTGYQIHGDRKSTRLNSSHVKISYAVFCLKKKR